MENFIKMPSLRFPTFATAWKVDKLKDIAEINPANQKLPDNFIYIDLESVERGILKKENRILKIDAPSRAQRILKMNDILFQMVRPYQMNNLFFDKLGNYVASTGYAQIRAHQNSRYLFQYLHTPEFVDKVIEKCTGTGYPAINSSDLSNISICLPCLKEQQKIADFFTAIDGKLSQLKKKKKLLEQYKKGTMQAIFSQQLRFKQDGGSDFEGWKEKKLEDILTFGNGKDYRHLAKGKIPVFGTGGLMTVVNDYLYNGETVCIGRKGTIDKPMYFDGKIWVVDTLFYTHSFKNSLPKFVFHLFKTINWKEYNEATGVPSLSKSTIEKINLKLPCLAEQTKIATFLSAIDDKAKITETQIKQMENWKKGLLQQMFV